jgi:hypothetical protein
MGGLREWIEKVGLGMGLKARSVNLKSGILVTKGLPLS